MGLYRDGRQETGNGKAVAVPHWHVVFVLLIRLPLMFSWSIQAMGSTASGKHNGGGKRKSVADDKVDDKVSDER